MRRALLIWLVASALGAALIVLLPEQLFGAGALFRLSDRHGPGWADAPGLAILLGGWLVFLAALWSRRRRMQPHGAALTIAAAALVALAGCIAAFAADLDAWAIALGAIAFAAQIALAMMTRPA